MEDQKDAPAPEAFSEAEIDAIIKRTGLNPDAELRKALHDGWPIARKITAMMRRPRAMSAEPSHVFTLPIPEDLR